MLGRRELVYTVMIQGVGSAATLFTTMIVAGRFGPAGQGFWASFKSILDVVAVAGAYGFPAGFAFLINTRGVSDRALMTFAWRYGILLLPVTWGALVFAHATQIVRVASTTPRIEIVLTGLAGTLLALQAIVRGVTLATASTRVFSVVSAAPAVVLLALAAVWPNASAQSLMTAATFAALISLALTIAMWQQCRTPEYRQESVKLPFRELIAFGGWNFVVSIALTVIPALTFQVLTAAGADRRHIGWLSLAVLIQSALLTPANMLGPVLYNAWSKLREPSERQASYARLHRLSIVGSVTVSLAIGVLLHAVAGILRSRDFGPVIPLAWLLLAAVPLGYSSRLMANVLLASGEARLYAMSTLTRLFVVTGFLYSVTPTIQTAALAWVVAEAASVVLSAALLVSSLKWRWTDTLGLRQPVAAAIP